MKGMWDRTGTSFCSDDLDVGQALIFDDFGGKFLLFDTDLSISEKLKKLEDLKDTDCIPKIYFNNGTKIIRIK